MEHINSTKGAKKLLKILKYPQNLAINEEKQSYTTSQLIFRAIFDLSNKIALLILLRMFALYVESKKLKID